MFSDYLDGWLARRFDQASDIGTLLDPLADKLLVSVVGGTLVYSGKVSGLLYPEVWGLWVARDFGLIGCGLTVYGSKIDELPTAEPSFVSKLNTALQMLTITSAAGLLTIYGGQGNGADAVEFFVEGMAIGSVFTCVGSAVGYTDATGMKPSPRGRRRA